MYKVKDKFIIEYVEKSLTKTELEFFKLLINNVPEYMFTIDFNEYTIPVHTLTVGQVGTAENTSVYTTLSFNKEDLENATFSIKSLQLTNNETVLAVKDGEVTEELIALCPEGCPEPTWEEVINNNTKMFELKIPFKVGNEIPKQQYYFIYKQGNANYLPGTIVDGSIYYIETDFTLNNFKYKTIENIALIILIMAIAKVLGNSRELVLGLDKMKDLSSLMYDTLNIEDPIRQNKFKLIGLLNKELDEDINFNRIMDPEYQELLINRFSLLANRTNLARSRGSNNIFYQVLKNYALIDYNIKNPNIVVFENSKDIDKLKDQGLISNEEASLFENKVGAFLGDLSTEYLESLPIDDGISDNLFYLSNKSSLYKEIMKIKAAGIHYHLIARGFFKLLSSLEGIIPNPQNSIITSETEDGKFIEYKDIETTFRSPSISYEFGDNGKIESLRIANSSYSIVNYFKDYTIEILDELEETIHTLSFSITEIIEANKAYSKISIINVEELNLIGEEKVKITIKHTNALNKDNYNEKIYKIPLPIGPNREIGIESFFDTSTGATQIKVTNNHETNNISVSKITFMPDVIYDPVIGKSQIISGIGTLGHKNNTSIPNYKIINYNPVDYYTQYGTFIIEYIDYFINRELIKTISNKRLVGRYTQDYAPLIITGYNIANDNSLITLNIKNPNVSIDKEVEGELNIIYKILDNKEEKISKTKIIPIVFNEGIEDIEIGPEDISEIFEIEEFAVIKDIANTKIKIETVLTKVDSEEVTPITRSSDKKYLDTFEIPKVINGTALYNLDGTVTVTVNTNYTTNKELITDSAIMYSIAYKNINNETVYEDGMLKAHYFKYTVPNEELVITDKINIGPGGILVDMSVKVGTIEYLNTDYERIFEINLYSEEVNLQVSKGE